MRFDPSFVGQMSVGLLLVQLVGLSIIAFTDDSQLLDCDDAFRSGCRNASQCHHKQRAVKFPVQGNNKHHAEIKSLTLKAPTVTST